MSELFKKQTVRFIKDGQRVPAGTPGAERKVTLSKCWYAYIGTHQVKLAETKDISAKMLTKLKNDRNLESVGLTDPHKQHKQTLLKNHVEDYLASLKGRACTRHVEEVERKLKKIVEACKFEFIADVKPEVLEEYLIGLRNNGQSIKTNNEYLGTMKAFFAWLVKNRRIASTPLAHLSKLNARTDRRHVRRSLSEADFAKLIEAARSGPCSCEVQGPDRAMLYIVAAHTGLRASELASLTPTSFRLEDDVPCVMIEAGNAKNRREASIPIAQGIVEDLREWLKGRRKDRPLWPGEWAKNRHGSTMVRRDMKRAGLPYQDKEGKIFDFHALRGQFITTLARKGIHPRTAQLLARHSDVNLTLGHYTHLNLIDLKEAVDTLPGIPEKPTETKAIEAKKTGTDGDLSVQNPYSSQSKPVNSGTKQSDESDTRQKNNPCPNSLSGQGLSTSDKSSSECWRQDLNLHEVNPHQALNLDQELNLKPYNPDGCDDDEKACLHRIRTNRELKALVETWDTLPENVRRAIVALASIT